MQGSFPPFLGTYSPIFDTNYDTASALMIFLRYGVILLEADMDEVSWLIGIGVHDIDVVLIARTTNEPSPKLRFGGNTPPDPQRFCCPPGHHAHDEH